jgi:hypothetical protein
MPDEHWATFSIYDHRTELYRRALLLFDRVLVPIPKQPIGRLSQQEIDQLSAEVDFLSKNDAAVRFDWDQNEFQTWQESITNEILATTLSRDRQYATRLQVAQGYAHLIPPGVDSVTAVPAYHDPQTFDSSIEQLKNDVLEAPMLEIVLPRLPVPAFDTPLSSIVEFRKQDVYRDSLYRIRTWQTKILPEILNEPEKRGHILRAAATDFDRWITQYSEAMGDAKFAKVKTVVISVLAVGATLSTWTPHLVAGISALASPLFSLRELRKPCWKIVAEKECAPAAIIYASKRI